MCSNTALKCMASKFKSVKKSSFSFIISNSIFSLFFLAEVIDSFDISTPYFYHLLSKYFKNVPSAHP